MRLLRLSELKKSEVSTPAELSMSLKPSQGSGSDRIVAGGNPLKQHSWLPVHSLLVCYQASGWTEVPPYP